MVRYVNKNEQIDLIKAAKDGDRKAFEQLYSEYRDKLYFFVLKNVGSRESAEDIVSETFLDAMQDLCSLKAEEAFGSWLYSIVYRKCIHYNEENARTAHFDSDVEQELAISDFGLNEPIRLPEDHAVNKQRQEQIKAIIDSLSPEMRSTIILYYYEERSVVEVAQALNIKEGTAKKRLFDARKKIRTKLEKLIENGSFCVAPLGAMLESSIDRNYAVSAVKAGAAVKGISAVKIAAVSAAAVAAVGVPVSLHLIDKGGWGGEQKPNSSSAVHDDRSIADKEDNNSDKLQSSSQESMAEANNENESSESPGPVTSSEIVSDESNEPSNFDSITPIPEGAETELTIFSYTDPNTSDDTALRMDLKLFKRYGGSVRLDQYSNSDDRYDELALRLMAGSEIPDMMFMDDYSFPSYAVKEFFQPIDGIIDFDSELWSETKETADLYAINGSHYAAPISITPTSLMLYRRDIVEENGLDDPYELYLEGRWNREMLYDLMEAFCSQNGNYGINGYFTDPLFRAEGLPIVGYTGKEFVNNMDNEKLLPIVDYLYDIKDRGFIASGWWDNGEKALENGNTLFYSMGPWAMTDSRPLTEQKYGLVPLPSEDNAYTVGEVRGMLWIAGSLKGDAMKTWLECMRYCETDAEAQDHFRKKFFENNPGWTDEMWEVYKSQTGFDKPVVSEYVYGLSAELTAIDQELGYSPADLVTNPINAAYLDEKYDWAQLKDMYSGLLDGYIRDYNRYIN